MESHVVILLAAGRGSRLTRSGRRKPKPLIKFGGMTLLERHLLWIERVVKPSMIFCCINTWQRQHYEHLLRQKPIFNKVKFLHVPFAVGTGYSIKRAIKKMPLDCKSILVALGDEFFLDNDRGGPNWLTNSFGSGILYLSNASRLNFKTNYEIFLGGGGRVTAIRPVSELKRTNARCGTGVVLLKGGDLATVRMVLEKSGDNDLFKALAKAVTYGVRLTGAPYSNVYMNVNTPTDIARTSKHLI